MKKAILSVFLVVLLLSCGTTTHIENSWRDPSAKVDATTLNKFLVAALLKNEATRRSVEDQMAALYPGKAVPSYSVFSNKALDKSDDEYKKLLQSSGYDGIVIMRLVNVEQEKRYVPGTYPTYYGTWWGYYRYAWPMYYDPGYYTTDKTYYVEVNVYSTRKEGLIWSGITSTMNPTSRSDLFGSVINAVSKRMKKEGFLK